MMTFEKMGWQKLCKSYGGQQGQMRHNNLQQLQEKKWSYLS